MVKISQTDLAGAGQRAVRADRERPYQRRGAGGVDRVPGRRGRVQPAGAACAGAVAGAATRPRVGGGDQFGGVQPGALHRADAGRACDRLVGRRRGVPGQRHQLCRVPGGAGAHRRCLHGCRTGASRPLRHRACRGHPLHRDPPWHRRTARAADCARHRRAADQRAVAGICRRRVPRRRRRTFDHGVGDRRRRHPGRALARPARPYRRPDVDRARRFAGRRACRGAGNRHRPALARRAGAGGVRRRHVERRHRDRKR